MSDDYTPPVEFRLDVRLATQTDIDALEADANLGDGASAIFVNGELLAVCNEYGTATLAAGDPARQEAVETLNAIACDLVAESDDGERFPRWAAPARVREVRRALAAYGQRLRTMWADFDGRTARDRLGEIAAMFEADDPKATADEFVEELERVEDDAGTARSGVGR